MSDKQQTDTADIKHVYLADPIPYGEKKLNHFTLQRPRGGALRGIQIQSIGLQDFDELCKLVPRISSPAITVGNLCDMDAADILQVSHKVLSFFEMRAS